jgi:hypothetical protein
MSFEHLSPDQVARIFTACVLVLMGIAQIAAPGCFWGIGIYFKGARASFSPEQRERLNRVLDARRNAEGDTEMYSRYVGVFTILIAPLSVLPAMPYAVPYALACLALATAMVFAYLNFRRATERRVAPLVRRSPWSSLPPFVVAATVVCVAGSAAFGVFPQFRLAAIGVTLAAIVLCAIAWRVALAPAILFGDDPQLEYLVDERVRFCRATGLLSLACAPPTVLVGLASVELSHSTHAFGAITLAVCAAFLVVMMVSLIPLGQRIRLA